MGPGRTVLDDAGVGVAEFRRSYPRPRRAEPSRTGARRWAWVGDLAHPPGWVSYSMGPLASPKKQVVSCAREGLRDFGKIKYCLPDS